MLSRSLRTVWRNLSNEVTDYVFNRSGTESGFLRFVGWFRLAALIGLTLRFGIGRTAIEDNQVMLVTVQGVLWGYFIFVVAMRYLADFHPHRFESTVSKIVQILVDIAVVAFFYAVAHDPHSDVFLLYFIPLLIIARYFEFWAILSFLGLTVLATITTWSVVVGPARFASPHFWASAILPRFGFLAMLTLFYLIYHRRRRLVGQIHRAEDELLSRFRDLTVGAFSVDRQLRVATLNDVMLQRHGSGSVGGTCYEAFCRSAPNGRRSCHDCPPAAVVERGEAISDIPVNFADKHGVLYPASVSALPILNAQGEIVGATAIVQDLSERAAFEQQLQSYAADIERTVDTLTQEDRARAAEMTRRLAAISRASAAVLSPDQSFGLDEIVKAAAHLLRCQAADVRQLGIHEGTGRQALLLQHAFGYTPEDVAKREFLDLNRPSIVVEAFHKGEPRCVEDVQAQPGLVQFEDHARKYNLHTMAYFPLWARGERIGTLSLYRNRRQIFSPEEMQLGQALANSLAATILNQDLLNHIATEARLRQKRLDAINALSRKLVPHDNIHSLARLVADVTREQLDAEVSAVFLLEGEFLYRTAISGVEPEWFAEECYKVGQGITGQVVVIPAGKRYGEPVIENAVDESALVVPEHLVRYRQQLLSGRVRHLMAVPLNGHEGTFGVLRVVNKLDDKSRLHLKGFTERDLDLMTTIAGIVAVAMENSRRLAEQTLLMTVGQTVTSSLSSGEILVRSLDHAVTMLDAAAGYILLPDKATGGLVLGVTVGRGAEQLRSMVLPPGKGIAGAVFSTGQPELVADVRQDARHYSEFEARTGFTPCTLLSVPIKTRERVIGVIEVVDKHRGAFTPADLHLLHALSAWIAIAIENARLYEAEQERRRLAEALLETLQTLSSTLDIDQILASILGRLNRVVSYDTASLFLRQDDKLLLRAQAGFSADEQEALRGANLDAKSNTPFQMMEATRRPLIIHDVHQEPVLDPIAGTGKIRSWIGAPLVFHNQVIGQLAVDNWEPNQYDENDASLVMAFAQGAAIALTNANLFAQQKERAGRLFALNQSLIGITSARSREETLDEIAQCVVDLMECDMSGVALYDKERDEIYAVPQAGHRGINAEYARLFRFPIERPGGEVLRSRQILTTIDAEADPDSIFGHRLTRPIGARGIMAAPLVVGTRLIGILYAATRSPRRFSDDEQSIFSILANQAAIAIRNTELLEQTERRAELLDLFHQISIAGQRTSDLERILNIVLTGVTADYGLRFNRAMLLLMDSEREQLVGYTGIGQTSHVEAETIWGSLSREEHTLDGYVREVLERGVPMWTPIHHLAKNLRIPVKTDSREAFSHVILTKQKLVINPADGKWLIDAEFYRLFDPGTFALVPLVIEGRVIGILVADNKFTGAPFTETDLELLSTCASQAAAAIERSRLHQALQQRIAVLNHLQEVGQYISDLTDLREVLRRIVKAANQVLEADISYLVPYDNEAKELLVDLGVSEGEQNGFEHERKFGQKGLTELVMTEPSGLLVINDVGSRSDISSRFTEYASIRSVAVVRLEFGNEIVGVLYINFKHHRRFKDEDLHTLRMFAHQAAIAIHNARLMEQIGEFATLQERDRLREDLHDALNTLQFKVMIPVENMRDEMSKQGNAERAEEMDRLWRFTRHTYQHFDRILQDMRDPVLAERGLVAALHSSLENIYNHAIELRVSGETRPSADVELALYRICQEAISNIVKHVRLPSGVTNHATIELSFEPLKTQLIIRDNGPGFSLDAVKSQGKGVGLQAMENWARKIGADLSIHSAPGECTRIELLVPYQEAMK